MRLSTLLALLLALGHSTRVPAQTTSHDRQLPGAERLVVNEDLYPFYHGVASGDPLSDRVVIWTRVTPDSLNGQDITVNWHLATDPDLKEEIQKGSFTTGPARDYTVKIDVAGLVPGATYYYGFTALDRNSLTGRTKTTPTGNVDHLRFGVVSCSNFQSGYFNGYGRLAKRNDLDAVIHLGDYLYEYRNFAFGSPEVWEDRVMEPDGEIVSLFDYRTRFSTYHLDEDLLRLHQQHPMIAVWDDHEFANNSYVDGAQNHQPNEGDWETRKQNSKQAYFEWMPIRETNGGGIYRAISYGELADLLMLDTRIEGRDQQVITVDRPELNDPNRTILGAAQKQWLKDRLTTSTAKWKLVGNQVIFSQFNIGWAGSLIGATYDEAESTFLDIWDGYPAERTELVDFMADNALENIVILTGDFHTSLAFEVADPPVDITFRELDGFGTVPNYAPNAYDPTTGAGAVAVEFASPSVASANFDETTSLPVALALQGQLNQPINPTANETLGNPNPHLKYVDLTRHGYFLLDVTEERVQADYFYTPILERTDEEDFDLGLSSPAGGHHLTVQNAPAPGKAVQDIPAPADPPALSNGVRTPSNVTLLALAPNPTDGRLELQYALREAGQITIDVLDATGRRVRRLHELEQPAGLYGFSGRVDGLPAGPYFLRIGGVGQVRVVPFVKW